MITNQNFVAYEFKNFFTVKSTNQYDVAGQIFCATASYFETGKLFSLRACHSHSDDLVEEKFLPKSGHGVLSNFLSLRRSVRRVNLDSCFLFCFLFFFAVLQTRLLSFLALEINQSYLILNKAKSLCFVIKTILTNLVHSR